MTTAKTPKVAPQLPDLSALPLFDKYAKLLLAKGFKYAGRGHLNHVTNDRSYIFKKRACLNVWLEPRTDGFLGYGYGERYVVKEK